MSIDLRYDTFYCLDIFDRKMLILLGFSLFLGLIKMFPKYILCCLKELRK